MTPARDRFEKPLPITMKELGDPEYMLEYVKECMRTFDTMIQERKREHTALVRAVKRLREGKAGHRLTYERLSGYVLCCQDVLALLAKRKGGHPRPAKPAHFFTGQLDEIRIWERALTPDEAKQIVQDKLPIRHRKKSAKALLAGRKGKP